MLPTVNPGRRSFGSVEYHDVHTCRIYHITLLKCTDSGLFLDVSLAIRANLYRPFSYLCNLTSKQKGGSWVWAPKNFHEKMDYNVQPQTHYKVYFVVLRE